MLCIPQRTCSVLGDFPLCWFDKWSRAGWVVVAPTARAIPHEIDRRSAGPEEGLDPDRDTFLFLLILTRGFLVIVHLTLRFQSAFGLRCWHPPPPSCAAEVRSPSRGRCRSAGPLPSAEARDPRPWETLQFCFKTRLPQTRESQRKPFKAVLRLLK